MSLTVRRTIQNIMIVMRRSTIERVRDSEPKTRRNIVFFGETGVGKSSIINMILGTERAKTSNNAKGCTGDATCYEGSINGRDFRFWDTVGLNEGDKGTMSNMKAASALYHLLRKLSDSGGVSLLVFCMRAPRITKATEKNWVLFRDIICNGQVPTAIVVTHLELDMNGWWSKNVDSFYDYRIMPTRETYRQFSDGGEAFPSDKGVACITTIKGPVRRGEHVYQEEYDMSSRKVRKLIFEAHLDKSYNVDAVTWFQETLVRVQRSPLLDWILGPAYEKTVSPGMGIYKMMDRWEVSEVEARKIACSLEGMRDPGERRVPHLQGGLPEGRGLCVIM
ncbi:hypothetical protein NMY22_g19152 [Coprinellus aureogranulatus]|nr:hypothetical protein NMY22_g19152 [Coprinellus aureogranulatus]